MAESDEIVSRMLRHILTNLTSTSSSIAATTISDISRSNVTKNIQYNIEISPSPSPPTILAIGNTPTILDNPSTILNSFGVTTSTSTKTDQQIYNSTGYLVDQDELEYSILAAFSDMQTVFLACIFTLLPLIFALAVGFGIRHAWRKYRQRKDGSSELPWYRGVCSRDDTPNSLHHRSSSGSINIQPATRILSAQDLVNGLDGPRYICETEVMNNVDLASANVEYTSPGNNLNSKNANGNIITLTLKNNHLIVETEERTVTMEDNSFVVEVEPKYIRDDVGVDTDSTDNVTGKIIDQQALVHREEVSDDRPTDFENKIFGSINTGLSQSDLSISSQGSVNRSYHYGNQVEYESEQFSYSMYENGNYENDIVQRKFDGGSKWVEFDKSPDIDKSLLNNLKTSFEKDSTEHINSDDKDNNVHSSIDSSSSLEHQDSTDASNSTDTVKSNPNLQMNGTTNIIFENNINNDNEKLHSNKPIITGALLKDENNHDDLLLNDNKNKKIGNGILINGDNKQQQITKPEASVFVACHKRSGSIPPRLIDDTNEIDRKKSIDIYSQIKTTILPNLNPKFEILQNDISPIDENES